MPWFYSMAPGRPCRSLGAGRSASALPRAPRFPNGAVGSDEVVLPLQISPEPKLNWQAAANLRIDRAVDENGRPLTATAVIPMMQPDQDELIFVNGIVMQAPARRAGPVGVRVHRGTTHAMRLSELAGTVTAHVRLAEALAVVDAPLKAAGQAVRGRHGVNLAIKSISKGESGDVTLSADVKVPLDIQLPQIGGGINGVMIGGGINVQMQAAIVGQVIIGPGGPAPNVRPIPPGSTEYQGLSLEDSTGRRFTATKGVAEPSHFGQDGSTLRVSVTFHPPAKGQEPARLVFTATRPATIDVPFVVKDVPLS